MLKWYVICILDNTCSSYIIYGKYCGHTYCVIYPLMQYNVAHNIHHHTLKCCGTLYKRGNCFCINLSTYMKFMNVSFSKNDIWQGRCWEQILLIRLISLCGRKICILNYNLKPSGKDEYELDLTLLEVSQMHILFHSIKILWPTM